MCELSVLFTLYAERPYYVLVQCKCLQAAVNALIVRHPMLRTYPTAEGWVGKNRTSNSGVCV